MSVTEVGLELSEAWGTSTGSISGAATEGVGLSWKVEALATTDPKEALPACGHLEVLWSAWINSKGNHVVDEVLC